MPAHDPNQNSDDEHTIVEEADASSQKIKTVETEMFQEDGELTRTSEPTRSSEPTLADIHVEDHGNIIPEAERINAFPSKKLSSAARPIRPELTEEPTSSLKYLFYVIAGIAVIAIYSYNKKNSQFKTLVHSFLQKEASPQNEGPGTLRIIVAEPGAIIKVNGQAVNLIDDQLSAQLGQNLQIRVEKEGFETFENIVTLKDLAPVTLNISLQPEINGKFSYFANPPSTISVSSGEKELISEFGEISNRMLAPGKYKIHVINLNLSINHVEEIEIQAGKFLRLERDLSENTKLKKP